MAKPTDKPKTDAPRAKRGRPKTQTPEQAQEAERRRQERLRERRRAAHQPSPPQVRKGAIEMLNELLRFAPDNASDFVDFDVVEYAFIRGVVAIVDSGSDESPIDRDQACKSLMKVLNLDNNAAVACAIRMPPVRIQAYANDVETALIALATNEGFRADRDHLSVIKRIVHDTHRRTVFEGFYREGGADPVEETDVAKEIMEACREELRQVSLDQEKAAKALAAKEAKAAKADKAKAAKTRKSSKKAKDTDIW